jgi:zinc transport system substrate-binding protein
MKSSSSFLLFALCLALSGCGPSGGPEPKAFSGTGKPKVLTTNYPLTWMAERIGGDAVVVEFRAPEDGDPAFWEPTEVDVAAFQSADLILRNGATYEKWADKVSLPDSTQVDTSRAFAEQLITIKDEGKHSHGAKGEHSHAGVAFTTWIDLTQAVKQADAIRAAFGKLLPDKAATFDANFAAVTKYLDALDAEVMAAAKMIGNAPLVASHPIYQYFARRYALNIKSVLWEPETVPDEAAMADLAKILADHPAAVMLWEGDPAPESVRMLQSIGVKSIVFDPCGNRPGEGADFLSVMKANAANLAKAKPAAP